MISNHNLYRLRESLLQYDRIVITGATGWLGRETAELLARTLGDEFSRRIVLVSSTPKITQIEDYSIKCIGWEDFKTLKSIDLLIHFAYLNQDRADLIGFPEFIETNRLITSDVMRVLNVSPGCDVLAASSGAAGFYSGNVDSVNSMEVYASLKLESERHFLQNPNIGSIVNMRIWNVTGSGLDINSNYAIANFFKQALNSNRIELTGNGNSTRTYIDVKEMMFTFLQSLDKSARTTTDSGGYQVSLLNLASKVLYALGLPGTSISLNGESKQASHYNPNSQLFNQMAREFKLNISNIDSQIANLTKIFTFSR